MVAVALRLSTLAFFALATAGLWRVGGFLWERGSPLALVDLLVASAWIAIALTTLEAWTRASLVARR